MKQSSYRGIEIMAARAICQAEGDYCWRYLKDVEGNPSTAWKYDQYLKMGRAAVHVLEKAFAKGNMGRWLKEQK